MDDGKISDSADFNAAWNAGKAEAMTELEIATLTDAIDALTALKDPARAAGVRGCE